MRALFAVVEIVILSALVLATRWANYQEVFVGGNVHFTDADCYARMTRARMCFEHPGLILRHHDFENSPAGTTPHTTAPFDYLIVALAVVLKSFSAQPLDLAGAIVSPFLAILGVVFLWFWSRRMNFRYRWMLLLLYALSPILVHGTELGRPDHQSLLIFLTIIALCAEWSLQVQAADTPAATVRMWSILSGTAWGLALWVSFYEPFVLLALIALIGLTTNCRLTFGRQRRIGWILFVAIVILAFLIERRVPSLSLLQSGVAFQNWSRTIGELAHVALFDRIWFVWAGYLIVITPILIWIAIRRRRDGPIFLFALLVATFGLTMWQARWSYFFILIFSLALPELLEPFKPRFVVWFAFALSLRPVLQFWDAQIWPNENEIVRRAERRAESIQLRELAMAIQSTEKRPFLAPWWLSPSITYWSGQPAVAGSSHEALDGIAVSARFYLSTAPEEAREILRARHVEWIFSYDWGRLGRNSASLLGGAALGESMGEILDRRLGQAPDFLVLSGQNGAGKLFRFADKL